MLWLFKLSKSWNTSLKNKKCQPAGGTLEEELSEYIIWGPWIEICPVVVEVIVLHTFPRSRTSYYCCCTTSIVQPVTKTPVHYIELSQHVWVQQCERPSCVAIFQWFIIFFLAWQQNDSWRIPGSMSFGINHTKTKQKTDNWLKDLKRLSRFGWSGLKHTDFKSRCCPDYGLKRTGELCLWTE